MIYISTSHTNFTKFYEFIIDLNCKVFYLKFSKGYGFIIEQYSEVFDQGPTTLIQMNYFILCKSIKLILHVCYIIHLCSSHEVAFPVFRNNELFNDLYFDIHFH